MSGPPELQALLAATVRDARRGGATLQASYTGLTGLVVATLRRSKSMTQSELADASGISQPTISRIEKGEVDMTALQMEALANVFGQRPGFILDAADGVKRMLIGNKVSIVSKPKDIGLGLKGAAAIAVAGAITAGPLGLLIGAAVAAMLSKDAEN